MCNKTHNPPTPFHKKAIKLWDKHKAYGDWVRKSTIVVAGFRFLKPKELK